MYSRRTKVVLFNSQLVAIHTFVVEKPINSSKMLLNISLFDDSTESGLYDTAVYPIKDVPSPIVDIVVNRWLGGLVQVGESYFVKKLRESSHAEQRAVPAPLQTEEFLDRFAKASVTFTRDSYNKLVVG